MIFEKTTLNCNGRLLSLEKPVVMGCSIGGRVVLHLALRHGSKFRAAIGLQSALYAEDRSLGDPAPKMALRVTAFV